MKSLIKKIVSNPKLISYFNPSQELNETYQKVDCYTIKNDKPQTFKNVKLEKGEDDHINLNEIQKQELLNYIRETLTFYERGDIYLSVDQIKHYKVVSSNILSGQYKLNRKSIEYVIRDRERSYGVRGYQNPNNKYNF